MKKFTNYLNIILSKKIYSENITIGGTKDAEILDAIKELLKLNSSGLDQEFLEKYIKLSESGHNSQKSITDTTIQLLGSLQETWTNKYTFYRRIAESQGILEKLESNSNIPETASIAAELVIKTIKVLQNLRLLFTNFLFLIHNDMIQFRTPGKLSNAEELSRLENKPMELKIWLKKTNNEIDKNLNLFPTKWLSEEGQKNIKNEIEKKLQLQRQN